MGKARREAKEREERENRLKRNRRIALIVAAVVVAVVGLIALATIRVPEEAAEQELEVALQEDESLKVERSALVQGFNYIDWGGEEELILYKNAQGEIAAAFDTCEECYTDGDVHFTPQNGNMVCSVCGTVQPLSGFGAQSWGGCRPLAIPDEARHDTDTQVVLSASLMDYARHMFLLWNDGELSMTLADYQE